MQIKSSHKKVWYIRQQPHSVLNSAQFYWAQHRWYAFTILSSSGTSAVRHSVPVERPVPVGAEHQCQEGARLRSRWKCSCWPEVRLWGAGKRLNWEGVGRSEGGLAWGRGQRLPLNPISPPKLLHPTSTTFSLCPLNSGHSPEDTHCQPELYLE